LKRLYQQKLFDAAEFYCKEGEKCYKARAYFSALVARSCELEALLRAFDFVESKPKDRCRQFNGLINRAFARHWIPNDALRYWKKTEHVPLKTVLHEIREARNGVHANLLDKGFATRPTAANVTFVVHAMYSFLETKNARNLMKHLYQRGEITPAEYRRWMKDQQPITW
jgi:hypothetical protein